MAKAELVLVAPPGGARIDESSIAPLLVDTSTWPSGAIHPGEFDSSVRNQLFDRKGQPLRTGWEKQLVDQFVWKVQATGRQNMMVAELRELSNVLEYRFDILLRRNAATSAWPEVEQRELSFYRAVMQRIAMLSGSDPTQVKNTVGFTNPYGVPSDLWKTP
jgi:hypothetical protein